MAARIVTYFQKGTTPSKPQVASALKALAYEAVKHLNLDAKEILIRGELYHTTTINGKIAKDLGGFHSIISVRTADDIKNQTFTSVHAYTAGKNDFTLVKASPAAQPLPITATNSAKKPIWPQNLAEEAIIYVDPPAEPEFAPNDSSTGSGEL
ncbi:MAG: hypothetical protein Q9217_006774 [Psora testacea]